MNARHGDIPPSASRAVGDEWRMGSLKNYRVIIDKMLDLADPGDPIELAHCCENMAAVLRQAAAQRDIRRETERAMAAVAPWFDPNHPINVP